MLNAKQRTIPRWKLAVWILFNRGHSFRQCANRVGKTVRECEQGGRDVSKAFPYARWR